MRCVLVFAVVSSLTGLLPVLSQTSSTAILGTVMDASGAVVVVQTVEVTSQAALLNTDQATLGQVVSTRRVEELPLNGRNIGALAVLQPGVQYGGRMGLTDLNAGGGGGPRRRGRHHANLAVRLEQPAASRSRLRFPSPECPGVLGSPPASIIAHSGADAARYLGWVLLDL